MAIWGPSQGERWLSGGALGPGLWHTGRLQHTGHNTRVPSAPLARLTRTRSLQAEGVKAEPFESHSALEIAEQLTLLDHLVFRKIPYE